MNALTTIDTAAIGLVLPDDLTFDAWADLGRSLLTNQRRAEWLVGDWASHGRRHYPEQLSFLSSQIGVDTKRLTIMASVAEAFPESQRAANLSFDTHREIAAVQPADRLQMLKQAADATWTAKEAHHHVVQYKHEQGALWDDDDKGASWATEMIRCWNRAPTPADRRYAFELMQASGFAPINEDEVTHV